jgi:hypothetical protein
MPDKQPPPFPGTPEEPKTPRSPEAPEAPRAPLTPSAPPTPGAPPTPSASPVSDYGTPPQPNQTFPTANRTYSASNQAPPQSSQAYPQTNPYASTQYPAAPYAPGTISAKKGPSGLAVSALIIGSLALLGSFIPFLNYFTGFFAFVGLVLGVIAIFLKSRKKTLAIVASSVSLLALILSIVLSITYSRLFFDGIDSIESNYPTSTSIPVEPENDPPTGEQGAPAAGDVGSRENPVPLGSSVELAQLGEPTWQITVSAPTLNADAAVAAENSFSDTAPAGTSFALVPITATYVGAETAYAAYVQVGFEAADGTMYNEYDVIAVAPGAIDSITALEPGTSVSGNIAIAIPATGVEQGLWVVSSLDGTKFYFAPQ